MRTSVVCLTVLVSVFPAACLAGESLVNGSFENGTNDGWSIIAWRPANYHNPPIQQCGCGHNLTAPDGHYFAGITYPNLLSNPPASPGHVYYLQGVDVKNYDSNADRTNYEFEIWVQLGWAAKFKAYYNNNQRYVIWWTDNGLMPNDGAHVRIQDTINEGDTIEIDAGGPNRRVYEFDTDSSIRPTSDVAVPAGDRKWSTVVPAFITAVNNDTLAPCTAAAASSATTSWRSEATVRQREVVLTWKTPDAGGATVTSEYNTASQIFTTNFLRAAGAVQHAFQIQFMIPAVWIMDADNENANNFTDWRRLKVSGSIPATPRSVVLEIDVFSQASTTMRHNCFDGVVFSAESAMGSSIGPFDGDVAPVYNPPGDPNGELIGHNSGFEIAPYDQNHCGGYVPDPPPGWGLWANFKYDPATCTNTGGPIKGYTNGQTTPNDPLGIATPSGDHFFGRSKINTGTDPCILQGKNLDGWWGHVLPVRKWSPSATGLRWRVHYLSKIWDTNNSGYQFLQICWDAQPAWRSILIPPANPLDAGSYLTSDDLYARIEPFAVDDRSITKPEPTEFSGFSEFEQAGEMTMTDLNGVGHVPQYVLLEQKMYATSSSSEGDHTRAFKLLFDKVDFYAEAVYGPNACGEVAADFDKDGDVDQEDFAHFQECITGVDGGILLPPNGPDCFCADLDKDSRDVDQSDFDGFERCASGPGIPADPACDEEACCLSDGSCVDSHPVTCSQQGGTSQGTGTRCATTECPSP